PRSRVPPTPLVIRRPLSVAGRRTARGPTPGGSTGATHATKGARSRGRLHTDPARTEESAMPVITATSSTDVVAPFRVVVPEAAMQDLRARSAAWRAPEREPGDDQSQGVQLATMQELARHWAVDYDFGRLEATLNALPQFTTTIDNLDIYFIHVRSQHEN